MSDMYASNFCRFANGASCQDIDQVLLHGDLFLVSAFSSSFFYLYALGKNTSFGVNCQLKLRLQFAKEKR